MGCYVSSNNERVYVALESSYGEVPAITAANRIPLLNLGAKQVPVVTGRKDKTGSRTFVGLPNTIRRTTSFTLNTLMTEWVDQTSAPTEGPLFQAALGATPVLYSGGTVESVTGQTQIVFTAAHGLSPGQAITSGIDIRFVAAVENSTTVFINAPFTITPTAGAAIGATMTYNLAEDLPSLSIFDYWDPSGAVDRILIGAAMDKLTIKVNGDFQEFDFAGPSQDLLDSTSFTSGQGGLTAFPAEPAQTGFDYTIIPGHLGQVWMGATPTEFFTLTEAELTLENNIALRLHEFGSDFPRCITAGARKVSLNFNIFESVDTQTAGLYQAARQRSPISAMLQLGEQQQQLLGVYMPAMVPEVPQFDDSETRLQWKFQNDRAQGSVDDELYIAFG
jgi:hypothetical protein